MILFLKNPRLQAIFYISSNTFQSDQLCRFFTCEVAVRTNFEVFKKRSHQKMKATFEIVLEPLTWSRGEPFLRTPRQWNEAGGGGGGSRGLECDHLEIEVTGH